MSLEEGNLQLPSRDIGVRNAFVLQKGFSLIVRVGGMYS